MHIFLMFRSRKGGSRIWGMNDTDKFREEFNEAQAAAKSGDYKTAFKKFEHLAEQGIAAAQYCLGVLCGRNIYKY